MTREVGMKIDEQNRISSTLQFSGIFWANGEKINQLLKELENPNHDKWSEKRAADPKKMGEFLRSIRRFISTMIKNQYEQKIEEQVDAFGVSSFLPDDLNAFKGAKAQLKQKGSRLNRRPAIKVQYALVRPSLAMIWMNLARLAFRMVKPTDRDMMMVKAAALAVQTMLRLVISLAVMLPIKAMISTLKSM